MSYGQSIAPKVFHDQNTYTLTKAAYCQHMARALVRAGMKFLPMMSSYDILDPALEEGPYGTDVAGNYPYVFFFDFPTTEVFTVNGVDYRPCLGLAYGGDASQPNVSNGYASETVSFDLCVRLDGSNDCTQVKSYGSYVFYGTSGYGLGSGTQPYASPIIGALHYDYLWLPSNKPNWSAYPGTYGWRPITIQNTFVYLGKGGLVVCTGTGQGPSAFNTIHSFAVLFMGDRIPGRGRAPINDTNLPRCNPTVLLPLRSSHGEYISGSADVQILSFALGAQFDLQSAPAGTDPIYMYLWNLSNLERVPLYPDKTSIVRNSPRIVGAAGRHILDPIIGALQGRRAATSELYGPSDPLVGTTKTAPPWEDMFYAPKARWADVTAPIGRYEDPDTLLDWWLIPMNYTGGRLAVEAEGVVDVTGAAIDAQPAIQSTQQFDMSSAGFSSVFPRSATFEQTTSLPPAGQNFIPVPATDAMEASWSWYNSSQHWRRTSMQIVIPPTDDPEQHFWLVWDMSCRSTQAALPVYNTNAYYVRMYAYDVFGAYITPVYLSPNANGVVLAGRAPGEHGYDVVTYRMPYSRAHRIDAGAPGLAGCINVMWYLYDPPSNPSGTATFRISNIRLENRKRV